MKFEGQERNFLLLNDDRKLDDVREILQNPLDLAGEVVCRLFRREWQSLREDLDVVKGFAAGMTRASTLKDYPLADYSTLMFAFQQWFHSSYRARQGKVLEELLKRVLPKSTSFKIKEGKEARNFLRNKFGVDLKSDIDIVAVAESGSRGKRSSRILLIQLRSRDDTGGTTAKGSLADALKELIRGQASDPTLYLIGIWDQRASQQRVSTINKIRSSLQDMANIAHNLDRLADDIENGVKIKDQITLQLAYGSDRIIEAIVGWDPSAASDASGVLSEMVRSVEQWDDLWVAYAVASVEIDCQALKGISNIDLLVRKCRELGISLNYKTYDELQKQIERAVDLLIPAWNEDTLPVKSPRDQALYIRDMLFLMAIYEKYCRNYGGRKSPGGGSRGTSSNWPSQPALFTIHHDGPRTTDRPRLVSFRALVPEITDTNYLTHGLFYYPAKFIPHVPRFCLKEYTARGDWVIDPFAGSATVGLEAVLMGRNALLLDLNPMICHIVPLKILFREDVEPAALRRMLDEMRRAAEGPGQEAIAEFHPALSNISYWYHPDVFRVLSRYWGWVKSQGNNAYARIIEAALLKASKHFSYAEHRAPKLFKSRAKLAEIDEVLRGDWKSEMDNLIYETAFDALLRVRQLAHHIWFEPVEVIYRGGVDTADPESFRDIPPRRFTAIITSPPYLQAQEYIRTFKLELAWLGYTEEEIRRLSRLEIPYRKAEAIISTPTLDRVRRLLNREDLRALVDAYFYYTLRGLENASRLLLPGGFLCVFVGNPKVDEFEVETWRIMKEYFSGRGFVLVEVYEDRIKNRQLFRGRKNKNPEGIQSEFLLIMRKE